MAYTVKSPDEKWQCTLSPTVNNWKLEMNFGFDDGTGRVTGMIEHICTIVSMSIEPHKRTYMLYLRKGDLEKLITALPNIMQEGVC